MTLPFADLTEAAELDFDEAAGEAVVEGAADFVVLPALDKISDDGFRFCSDADSQFERSTGASVE